jgi:hypothetical protein
MSVEFKRFLIMSAGVGTVIATLALAGTTGLIDWLYHYHRIVFLMPTGAFILGILAGSGYGVAGWYFTRLRFTPHMLWAVAISMVVAYGALVVMEYSQNAPDEMGFVEYFDASTQLATISTEARLHERATAPKTLGTTGYTYRFLELMGLTLGGMGALFIVPAIRKRLGMRDHG